MKPLFFLVALMSFFCQELPARQPDSTIPKIYFYVEQMPEPSVNINQYLQENLQYPSSALERKIQGRVIVHYSIDATGHIDSVNVKESVDPALDAEAMRVVSGMPRWKPGLQNGKAVRVYFTIPVSFRIDDGPGPYQAEDRVDSLALINSLREKDSVANNYAPEPAFDWFKYIKNNIPTPKAAHRDKLVHVRFEVAPDGEVTEVSIESSEDERLNEATLKLARRMALRKWRPGKRNGEHARYHCVLPFYYPK